MITNKATNAGYGLVHIEARHGAEIRKAGYNSVLDFIEEVAQNYEVIKEGHERDGIKTYMLQLTDKHNNTLMVELSGDGTLTPQESLRHPTVLIEKKCITAILRLSNLPKLL